MLNSVTNPDPYRTPLKDDGNPPCNGTTPASVPCYPYPEEVLYDVINSVGKDVINQWAPFRQWNIPSRDLGKQTAGCTVLGVWKDV
jgi:hypothetical protein